MDLSKRPGFLPFFRKSHGFFEILAKPWRPRQIQTEFLPSFVYDRENFHKIWKFRKDEYQMQKVSQEYLLLFNAITDAEESLCRLRARLMDAQRKAEELYIAGNDAGPFSQDI